MNPISVLIPEDGEIDCTPSYLFDYAHAYRENPHHAAELWFRDAAYGLSIHYGLESLIGQGDSVLANGILTPDAYRLLPSKLEAVHFDPIDIVQLAIASGMRYVSLCVVDADGFALYNTHYSDFSSAHTPAHRDFLAEMASVCEYNGIGLGVTYVLSRHNAPVESLEAYEEYVHNQLHEILTQYGPIALVNLVHGVDSTLSDLPDLYKHIRHLQPQTLIAFNQGVVGSEDFFRVVESVPDETDANAAGFIYSQTEKTLELHTSMNPGHWAYHAESAGKHRSLDELRDALRQARQSHCNLLVHTSLMPDGSLDLEDMNTLLELGKEIEQHGYPGTH